MAKLCSWEYDHHSGRLECFGGMERIFNLTEQEPAEPMEFLLERLPAEDREMLRQAYDWSITQRSEFEVVCRVNLSPTDQRHVQIRGMHRWNTGGSVTGALGVAQDITRWRRVEESLARQEDLMSLLMQKLPLGVFAKDVEQGLAYVLWNPKLERMLGISAQDALGKNDVELLGPELATRFRRQDQDVLEARASRYYEEVELGSSAHPSEAISISRVPIIGPQGQATTIFGFVEDITERRRLQEELRQSEKLQAIGQLAGGVAHDFNNRLMGILGFADLLREELDGHQARYANSIIESARRAADLTAKLLTFARKGRYVVTQFDMHELIGDVVEMLQRSLSRKVQVVHRLSAQPSRIVGDSTQIQNAILNIGINARDAMPNGGILTFVTETVEVAEDDPRLVANGLAPGQYMKVTVTDTGIGMDEATRKRAFEPFFTTKAPGKGTGMGLAMVFGTVQAHQGMIELHSRVSEGTSFGVYLPLRSEEIITIAHEAVLPDGGSGRAKHILLADDEEVILRFMRKTLEREGYQVSVCADGQVALELFEQNAEGFDLILVDMIMPQLSGELVVEGIRRMSPGVPIIVLSGYSMSGLMGAGLSSRVDGFVQKPATREELLRVIRDVLERSQVPRQTGAEYRSPGEL